MLIFARIDRSPLIDEWIAISCNSYEAEVEWLLAPLKLASRFSLRFPLVTRFPAAYRSSLSDASILQQAAGVNVNTSTNDRLYSISTFVVQIVGLVSMIRKLEW